MNENFKQSQDNEISYCFSAMAGEFPGASSMDELWALLVNGQTAPLRSLLPYWQVDAKAVFAPTPGTRNRVYLDKAFMLAEPVGEPSRQINIGLRVLQQLFHEPGLSTEQLPRERIGLILATSWSDESYFQSASGLAAGEQVRTMADQLQLGGPAFSVDTACSSFPYALEMARGLMSSGQADRVVVMAINTVLPLALYLGFSQLTAFSSDACLRAFGTGANGIVPAECACAFLLEPLHLAQMAGREPLGMLTAIGLSSDGAEGSVFSPGQHAQYMAYRNAWMGMDPASADYLETHGTATPLGDATELASIGQFFNKDNSRSTPLILGSIKATLGHTLAAAGGPSLAKALLMLRHQQIPAQPTYTPIPELDGGGALKLATAWDRDPKSLQRLAISSFGFGGANAHVIIDRAAMVPSPPCEVRQNIGYIKLDLAVVDAEAALGGAFSLAEFQQKLHHPGVLAFPQGRFAQSSSPRPADGCYLATDHVIDTHGYAMGPKALDHVDPFKLLVTDLTGRIVGRHRMLASNNGTVMMMCCNTGGESFSNAYTRSEFFKSHQGSAPNVVVADVASMLPSMLSGYPTKIFDFRGCHQTLAGEAGLLWQTLLTLPHWFTRSFDHVLLGAGRYISSASELRHCQHGQPVQGEGAGVLLLKPWREGEPALTVLRGAVMATDACHLNEACQIADINPDDLTQVMVCELDAAYQDNSERLHQCSGWLAEACGIEHLLYQVMTLQQVGAIEVRRQGKPWLWLFSERVQAWAAPAETDKKRLPYTLRFAHPDLETVAPLPIDKVTDTTVLSGSLLSEFSEKVTHTVLAGLRARTLIMRQLMAVPSLEQSLHRVINEVRRGSDGWWATLRVNEQHPYFFDHPLDHVPGILLIAGGLQLVERANIVSDLQFIHDLHVRFIRYVGKSSPINVWVGPQHNETWTILIKQHDQVVCRMQFALKVRPNVVPMNASQSRVVPCHRPALLHKHRQENVLVSELSTEREHYSVQTTPLPAGHFFTAGDSRYLSMVYFLEITRQCYMQIAHDVMQIPLGIPMNLVSLNFSLDNAIPRQHTLSVEAAKQEVPTGHHERTNLISLSLRVGQQHLGEAKIVAQVLEQYDITNPERA